MYAKLARTPIWAACAWAGAAAAATPELCEGAREQGYHVAGDWAFAPIEFRAPFGLAGQGLPELLQALRARGVHVVVALDPGRPLVAPADAVPADFPRDELLRAHRAVATELGAHATVVDLHEVADDGFYQHQDIHWTPEGARAAARAVAAAAGAAGVELPARTWTTEVSGTVDMHGFVLPRIAERCDLPKPEPDLHFPRYVTSAAGDAASLLLDDSTPEVVTLTNSFGDPRYNFDGFLREALQADVLAVSTTGGRGLASMLSWLESDGYAQHPPRLVVWHLRSTDLVAWEPDDLADQIPLHTRDETWRRVVPAVWACDAATREAEVVAAPGEVALFEDVPGGHFVSLQLDERPDADLVLVSRLADGTADELTLHRYGRLPGAKRLHASLPPDAASVSLRLPDGSAGTVRARLCPTPSPTER